ncbi:hypothetical protein ACH5RR_021759 [Cinchona calisaya]|uniref:Chromo domain-containing protein n=1 Tax=Cinchona calisaya TaxID=153742 RepID=A0ABD2ZI73_9GENT
MDFIGGLPKLGRKEVTLVVVDRLAKNAHFVGMSHPFTTTTVARIFLDQVHKLHGMPQSIVANRDKVVPVKELLKVGSGEQKSRKPKAILARRINKLKNAAEVQRFIKWKGKVEEEGTWEWATKIEKKFLGKNLEDKGA